MKLYYVFFQIVAKVIFEVNRKTENISIQKWL